MSDAPKQPDARLALRLFRTAPHACSYLSGKSASTVFVDPEIIPTTDLLSQLSEQGYRRSGPHLYRPDCEDCAACRSVRIPVAEFLPSRRYRRVIKRNRDIVVKIVECLEGNIEALALYQRYINTRHDDGDMYPATREQFDAFILNSSESTRFYCFYLGERLVAVTVCDVLLQGLSAVYTFFDPDEGRRSLGSLAILLLIEHARQLDLASVFLGYWVKGCAKMEYKLDFRPLDILQDKRWVRIK